MCVCYAAILSQTCHLMSFAADAAVISVDDDDDDIDDDDVVRPIWLLEPRSHLRYESTITSLQGYDKDLTTLFRKLYILSLSSRRDELAKRFFSRPLEVGFKNLGFFVFGICKLKCKNLKTYFCYGT